MDRNLDILWELVLLLILEPSPHSLYSFLAASPTAFSLFLRYGCHAVFRRIINAHDMISYSLKTHLTSSFDAKNAIEKALAEARELEISGAPDDELAAMHKDILVRAKEARKQAEAVYEMITAVEAMLRGDKTVTIKERALHEACSDFIVWWKFQLKWKNSAQFVVNRHNWLQYHSRRRKVGRYEPSSDVMRREFFGVARRRSERVKELKAKAKATT